MAMGTSNIKFFPHSIADMVLAITSEATDHEKEYMQDHNNSTYWESTSTANQNVDINPDGGSVYSVGYFALYHNLPADTVVRLWGADQSNYSDESALGTGDITISSSSTPILIGELQTTYFYKYYRLKITSLPSVAKINLFYLGATIEIATAFAFNWLDADKRHDGVILEESESGKRFGKEIQTMRRRWEWSWQLIIGSIRDQIDSILTETHGPAKPFIFTDIDGTDYFCRTLNSSINVRPPAYELYNLGPLIIEEEL